MQVFQPASRSRLQPGRPSPPSQDGSYRPCPGGYESGGPATGAMARGGPSTSARTTARRRAFLPARRLVISVRAIREAGRTVAAALASSWVPWARPVASALMRSRSTGTSRCSRSTGTSRCFLLNGADGRAFAATGFCWLTRTRGGRCLGVGARRVGGRTSFTATGGTCFCVAVGARGAALSSGGAWGGGGTGRPNCRASCSIACRRAASWRSRRRRTSSERPPPLADFPACWAFLRMAFTRMTRPKMMNMTNSPPPDCVARNVPLTSSISRPFHSIFTARRDSLPDAAISSVTRYVPGGGWGVVRSPAGPPAIESRMLVSAWMFLRR